MNFMDAIAGMVFFIILIACAFPLGIYMKNIFSGEWTYLTPAVRPLEKIIYKACRINEDEETGWERYALNFSVFSILGIALLFSIQLLQGFFPFNPQKLNGVRWDTAINTAISFVTNTNWQSYSGESTISYFTQMTGFTVQNFLSAAAGMAAGAAFIRGFLRREKNSIGNFWVDLTRSVLYVLLPLSIIVCILLLSQGVIQNVHPYLSVHTLEGTQQIIPMGPAASQIAIKQIGTNGGGFFNANSAHPFENPTMLSNLIQLFSVMIIPVSFLFMFGNMIKNKRQGRALLYTMLILTSLGLGIILFAECTPNPALQHLKLSGGANLNLEGKETRFGVIWSAVWSELTTITSSGSVNAMHDSFMPLAGMMQIFNIGVGEVIFGGVGTGLISMLFYVILAMFIAGLMIGRTPEFLGKKLGPFEMIMAVISLMIPMLAIVLFSALAVSTKAGITGISNPSSHGLSEILYAYTSAAGNNGSAFAGLSAHTVFYNLTLSAAMLIGRFATILPALAVAGSLAQKKTVPESSASFPTTGALFVGILAAVIIIITALDFFPVFTLGPILEHLNLMKPF